MAALKITLTRSPIGFNAKQRRTVEALGLTKMHKTVVRPDNAQIRGMVRAIQHMVTVETVDEANDATA